MRTLQEAEQYCNSFITPKNETRERTLTRMKNLMRVLGNPHKHLTVIHVGGSSGKGSTAYMTATLLETAGLTVGLHMKPHIQSITERMSINRVPISDDEFISYVNFVKPHIDAIIQNDKNNTPTYFELLVAIMLLYFNDHHVDVAVLEVGRGGRVDATNICPSKLFILTNISLVHSEILGKTLKEITKEKMGIVKNMTTVITGVTQPTLQTYIKNLCSTSNSQLKIIPVPSKDKKTYQEQNKTLAIEAAKTLTHITDEQIEKAFQSMKFPGRLEIVSLAAHTLIMDSAHNATNMRALVTSLSHLFPHKKMRVILPADWHQDAKECLQILTPLAKEFILVSYPERREAEGDILRFQKEAKKIHPQRHVTVVDITQFPKLFVSSPTSDIFLVTGSMTLLGAVRTSVHIPFALK